MKRILVLGHTGMLGHQVYNLLKTQYNDVYGISTKNYDLTTNNGLSQLNHEFESDTLVINCVGMLRQRLPKILTSFDIQKTLLLNSYLPHFLSERYNLIHITTDCVFSGLSDGNYLEKSLHDENDLYGKSKSIGEPTNALVLRTSIIGPEIGGRNLSLYEWFMNQNNTVMGFSNHFWNGVTTKTLAKCILNLIQTGQHKDKILRHIFSPARVSKYELLKMFNLRRKSQIEIQSTQAPQTIDRTLSTLYADFNNQFNIPSLEEQILSM